MQDTIKGLFMSWTAWFGALIVAWPEIASALGENLTALFGADANNTIMRVMGIVVIMLRLKTTQAVSEKAK
jgi:hypothetical protein